MKDYSLFSFGKLNYEEMEKVLLSPAIPPSIRQAFEESIRSHKMILAMQAELLEQLSKKEKEVLGGSKSKKEQPTGGESAIAENTGATLSSLNNESDKNDAPCGEDNEGKQTDNPDVKKGKGGTGKRRLPLGKTHYHSLGDDQKVCPSCGKGMHKGKLRRRTYVISVPLLTTETHISETCRCVDCGTQAVAHRNDTLASECIGRYHASAVSALASLRYQYGMASYRMEAMSVALGIKVSDSTQWYLFENAATIVRSFYVFLKEKIANAPVQHVDDTHILVLSLVKEVEREQEKAREQGKDPDKVRSGLHTTNVTGVFPEGELVIFRTGLHHAGEILAEILEKRTTEEQIIIMADASSVTTSKIDVVEGGNIKLANCNSHAVRKFKEIADAEQAIADKNGLKEHQTSLQISYFLDRYKALFENDKKTRGMSGKDRLEYHREHSLPLMEEMRAKIAEYFAQKEVEPNSDLGKVYKYFKNHYEKLSAFCTLENAAICNNLSERMLKCIIRHRKNSLFFRNQLGASVADILTSIFFTAKANNLNSIEYLKNLLIYQHHWKKDQEAWLPWNYTETIQKLQI